ncbi:DnaJ domain containing protein, partial [Asbolus verrucosus]
MPDHFLVTKRYNQQKPIKCWQCGIERTNISELFCENCSFIQSPQDTNNYFKIFELDEEFGIDPKQLTQKYRKLQSQLHPDKFTN